MSEIINTNASMGEKIAALRGKELCEFIIKLCDSVKKDAGTEFRGGIYPSNISEDENGELHIGFAHEYNWNGEELRFIAPELYWNSRRSPASDVYSIGLIMYYALSNGKIPYEGECDDPVLRRMTDDAIPVPETAGRRMGEIVSKALSFKADERYQSMDEMKAVVASCNTNLFLNGAPTAETVLKKSDDALSTVERMMVDIIEKSDEPVIAEKKAEEKPAVREIPVEETVTKKAVNTRRPGEMPSAPSNRVRVGASGERSAPAPVIQYTSDRLERERRMARAVRRRRRRPVIVILVMCVLLIGAAIIFNRITNDGRGVMDAEIEFTQETSAPITVKNPGAENEEGEVMPFTPPEPTPEAPREHTYQLFVEDVSWTEARAKCEELGGHLVVINNADELDTVIALADEYGVKRLWIGCYRENNALVWVNGDSVTFYPWGQGEPSAYDYNDDVSEDYVMLWYLNGWVYNDQRNDLMKDYAAMYSGTIAYICEFE